LRWPGWVVLACAVVVVVVNFTIPPDWLEGVASYVLGFEEVPPVTSDYRPIFPWLAPVLFGIGGPGSCRVWAGGQFWGTLPLPGG
ncbi:MAG: DUF1624 domain-containing protein, partial [Gammaproteobacteria bacterium]|nr:DUF1624 domain-containing protein [Gammaproteobacteria bacterium]